VTGYGGVVLWKNQGDGTFRDETPAAGLDAKQWSSSAGWGDLNGDGNLDLYVTNYVNWSFANHPDCSVAPSMREICSPKEFQPLADEIYFNQGDGTFRNASEEAGLRKDGKGLGVMLADLDNDRDLDIYVANDTTPNFFYLNDGHGRMEEVGMLRGVALDDQGFSNGSMGVELCDYNSDGLYDIWVANYEDETFALYRNEGRGFFLHVSQSTGVTALGQLFVGFGTQCADFDRDGDEDIVVSNGHVIKYSRGAPRRQLPLYLENRGKRFARVNFPTDSYFAAGHEGRGIVGGDLDNDGDWDLVASNLNDPVAVLRNDVEANRWIGVQLSGTHSNRDAIGTHLTLETTAGNWVRQLRGGGSYLSTSDPRLYWGVPRGVEVRRLIVQWPNGQQQVLESPPLERFIRVIQPRLPPGQ
jgi:enediyne biosynthesis protein E4